MKDPRKVSHRRESVSPGKGNRSNSRSRSSSKSPGNLPRSQSSSAPKKVATIGLSLAPVPFDNSKSFLNLTCILYDRETRVRRVERRKESYDKPTPEQATNRTNDYIQKSCIFVSGYISRLDKEYKLICVILSYKDFPGDIEVYDEEMRKRLNGVKFLKYEEFVFYRALFDRGEKENVVLRIHDYPYLYCEHELVTTRAEGRTMDSIRDVMDQANNAIDEICTNGRVQGRRVQLGILFVGGVDQERLAEITATCDRNQRTLDPLLKNEILVKRLEEEDTSYCAAIFAFVKVSMQRLYDLNWI